MYKGKKQSYANALGILVTSEVVLHVLDDELFESIYSKYTVSLPIKLASASKSC